MHMCGSRVCRSVVSLFQSISMTPAADAQLLRGAREWVADWSLADAEGALVGGKRDHAALFGGRGQKVRRENNNNSNNNNNNHFTRTLSVLTSGR
eukprot:6309613-Pyramimonas_sp.AAC.1